MATPGTAEASRASHDDLPQVISTLCRAFFADQIYRWMVPDDARRRQSAAAFYPHFVDACWPHGGVYTAGAGAGAALWLPPGEQLVADAEAEEFGHKLTETAGDDASSARMADVLRLVDEHHPTEDCWYLAFMGVDPPSQGQGIGSRLLAAVLAKADIDGVPAYLEASCPENRRLYERHGFRMVRELTVSDCPAIYAMWRVPTCKR
jgi:GNAT superfamily N-acetyltransferase